MGNIQDPNYLKAKLYENPDKLVIRKQFNSHAKVHLSTEIKDCIKKLDIKKILDVGCGNGDLLIELRKSGVNCSLYGVDISKGMFSDGEKISKKDNLNINFQAGNLQNLSFGDESFDVIIAKHMLYHVPDIKNGVGEVYRCLKKNGIFIITLNCKDNKPQLTRIKDIISRKYDITLKSGQDIVNVENVIIYLKNFDVIKTTIKEGKVSGRELFLEYFETFRTNCSPLQDDKIWKLIMNDVKSIVYKDKDFFETCKTGLIIAKKK